ncbi:methyltransferase RsmF C-terminal domain-like protein [Terrimonas pollutisoli]|uniref:methyltransferase RsmF C-terminal domain-like protein n=1 Tax=Terrimonas pollutisoli TaxID=3034147 RepID=UPI0023ED0794|nr:RsmF rRNA methyltransferase first C-terminal domain-containing protein [Terrimonas sp. H1YJ31]
MKHLPVSLMNSLADIKGFDKEAFEKVHASGEQITSIRINPFKLSESPKALSFGEGLGEVLWSQYGYYLRTRPSFTFDPLFHAGLYYVQEASSMFLEQALKQTVELSQPLKVLDLSAAPGGKSTHIQSLISKDSLLVSNEVIRSRANILKDNIVKWGCSNVMVTNNDPKDFARLENYFDVIVVDAPCSGSGLFRREPEAMNEWSLNNVQLCSQRQQRILADIWPALKKDGILIYSTCSYSKEEDEDILDWISRQLPTVNCQLSIKSEWVIVETTSATGNKGYRFWPDKVKGEGFFLACFKKKDGEEDASFKIKKKPEQLTKNEIAVIEKWVDITDNNFIRNQNTVYAWPSRLSIDFTWLLNNLKVVYSGTIIGEILRDKLVPDHALAMSPIISKHIGSLPLDYTQAINYLKRKEVQLQIKDKGWQLVNYLGHPLGWINILPNRVNNYYPKELRILKD